MSDVSTLYGAMDQLDLLVQREKYNSYILEHQKNVLLAYNKLFTNPDVIAGLERKGIIAEHLSVLRKELVHHDDSKFSDEEFEPYRKKFFKTKQEEEGKESEEDKMIQAEAYESAWKHHYLSNPHHPEHWSWRPDQTIPMKFSSTRLETATPMDTVSILHMLCDWEAMSIKFGTNTLNWYNTEAQDEKKAMNPETKERVEQIFTILYPGGVS